MAGIWDRVTNTTRPRLNSHLMEAAMCGYANGLFTSSEILAALNAQLGAGNELAAAAVTDLTNIRAQMDAQANATLKLTYMTKVNTAFISAEVGAINEAKFRSILGIV